MILLTVPYNGIIKAMKNIVSYAKLNTKSFSELPFNRVDALIFCWLAYFTFPDYLKGKKQVALKDFESTGLLPDKEMYAQAYRPRESKKLFNYLTKSPRFKNARLSDYADEKDESTEKQFAALCIELTDGKYFLAFRGTDPSFVGWKEDFNLICRFPVPSQEAALEYTQRQISKRSGDFYLGGHSKGGNVAVFSAMNLNGEMQHRLISVFNFDGPGYLSDVYSEQGYERISGKLKKIVPVSTFVGMLLKTRGSYEIIKSSNFSVLQHDPLCWTVKNCDFVILKDRTKSSKKLTATMNKWIDEFTIPEREKLIELVYGALNTLDIRDFNLFFKTLYKQIPKLIKEYKRTDAEDKKFFNNKIKRFTQILVKKT